MSEAGAGTLLEAQNLRAQPAGAGDLAERLARILRRVKYSEASLELEGIELIDRHDGERARVLRKPKGDAALGGPDAAVVKRCLRPQRLELEQRGAQLSGRFVPRHTAYRLLKLGPASTGAPIVPSGEVAEDGGAQGSRPAHIKEHLAV